MISRKLTDYFEMRLSSKYLYESECFLRFVKDSDRSFKLANRIPVGLGKAFSTTIYASETALKKCDNKINPLNIPQLQRL